MGEAQGAEQWPCPDTTQLISTLGWPLSSHKASPSYSLPSHTGEHSLTSGPQPFPCHSPGS